MLGGEHRPSAAIASVHASGGGLLAGGVLDCRSSGAAAGDDGRPVATVDRAGRELDSGTTALRRVCAAGEVEGAGGSAERGLTTAAAAGRAGSAGGAPAEGSADGAGVGAASDELGGVDARGRPLSSIASEVGPAGMAGSVFAAGEAEVEAEPSDRLAGDTGCAVPRVTGSMRSLETARSAAGGGMSAREPK